MKGMFFTLGITLMALVLLTLVVLVNHSVTESQPAVSEMVIFNRMQDEIEYTSRELISIVNLFNITVSVDGNTVSIQEDLPFPNVGRFQTNMQDWKTFTETNSNFNLDLDVTDISNTLPLVINDQVEYRHTNGLSGNKIEVGNASLVESYSIEILVQGDGNVTFGWNEIESGDQNFTLTVKTNNQTNSTSQSLDFSKGSELDVEIGGSEINIGIGKGSDAGFLKVDNEDQLTLTLTTNITLNTAGDVKVSFPDSIINISSSQYNISRVTTARVAVG